MKVRILGCGPSSGVPRIGNDWGECDPADPRNRRTRTSILLESAGQRFLVDCGPDLREQLLAANVAMLDGVIVTHDHADHCHGIDDLRPIASDRGQPLPLFARRQVISCLRNRFAYVFEGSEFYQPTVDPTELGDDLSWSKAQLRFVDQPHGRIWSLGIRADEGERSIAYAIDFHDLNDEMAVLYERVDLWICGSVPWATHPTHAAMDAVLGWARELNVGQLLLTHLDKGLDYATLAARLPDWAAPAFDGQELVV
jgi:phosphoribosyl 1,2-cyclic phosphate phosphodiesterase